MKTFTGKLTVLLTFGALIFPVSGYCMDSYQAYSNTYASQSNCDGGCGKH